MNPDDFDANRLKKSVKGLGTDEKVCIFPLVSKPKPTYCASSQC